MLLVIKISYKFHIFNSALILKTLSYSNMSYSYISLRGTSVARHEERNQISYIFQVHFTLKTGWDSYLFFLYLINNKEGAIKYG